MWCIFRWHALVLQSRSTAAPPPPASAHVAKQHPRCWVKVWRVRFAFWAGGGLKGAGGSRFFGLAAAFFAAARAATFSWAAFRICCLVLEVGVFLAENSRDGVELVAITSASVSRVLPSVK